MSFSTFLDRHPALTYFVVTFAISGGGVLLVSGLGGQPRTMEDFERLLPGAILAMVAGPSVAGLLLTRVMYGWPGLRTLLGRLLTWRVEARWYAAALLIAPLLMTAVLLLLSLGSPLFLPRVFVTGDTASLLISGIAIALAAGFIEELGWTGFAVPALRRRFGVLATGLIVGALWAAWHLIAGVWSSGVSGGALGPAGMLLDAFLFLALFRVLMVWVYDGTGSLLVVMLMHASLTACARILSPFDPGAMSAAPLLTFDVAWAAAVGLVIAAVGMANGWQFPVSQAPSGADGRMSRTVSSPSGR